MGLESFAWDYKMTCQISYLKAKNFIDSNKNIDTTQPFLHLFSEIWNTYHVNKNHFYKKGIYADLLKKHKIMDLTKKLNFEFSFKDKHYPLFSILFYTKYYIKHPRRMLIKNKRI